MISLHFKEASAVFERLGWVMFYKNKDEIWAKEHLSLQELDQLPPGEARRKRLAGIVRGKVGQRHQEQYDYVVLAFEAMEALCPGLPQKFLQQGVENLIVSLPEPDPAFEAHVLRTAETTIRRLERQALENLGPHFVEWGM